MPVPKKTATASKKTAPTLKKTVPPPTPKKTVPPPTPAPCLFQETVNIKKHLSPQDLPSDDTGKSIKRYIGKRGYILKKEFYNIETIHDLKTKLTVTPSVNTDYAGIPDSFPVYRESPNKFYMPKFYGIEHIGEPEANLLPEGQDISLTISKDFQQRPNQVEPIEVSWDAIQKRGGGILALSTGYGKTNIALYLIQRLGKKALIIVHKEFLMNQWKERIATFLPGTRVGVIQGPKTEIEGNDIVIGMLQSISGKNYPLDTFDSFGIVVIDECHRIPCQHFSKALLKINCRKMLGLSATPKRDDGLTKILKWYIGDVIYEGMNEDVKNIEVRRYLINSSNEKYKKEVMNVRHAPMIPTMINNIVDYDLRNRVILNIIQELIADDRRILLLSDRRIHLEVIHKAVVDEKICTVGYYVGGMKQQNLKISEDMQLILGTYSMASEGMDIPSLNTLILSTPKSKITQALGRIVRKKHVGITPLVIDLVDSFSIFNSQGNKRLQYYKKSGYPIHTYKAKLWGDDNIEIIYQNLVHVKASEKKTNKIKFNSKDFGFSHHLLPNLEKKEVIEASDATEYQAKTISNKFLFSPST